MSDATPLTGVGIGGGATSLTGGSGFGTTSLIGGSGLGATSLMGIFDG